MDGFQGREKEAVVISLVRSNEKGTVTLVYLLRQQWLRVDPDQTAPKSLADQGLHKLFLNNIMVGSCL